MKGDTYHNVSLGCKCSSFRAWMEVRAKMHRGRRRMYLVIINARGVMACKAKVERVRVQEGVDWTARVEEGSDADDEIVRSHRRRALEMWTLWVYKLLRLKSSAIMSRSNIDQGHSEPETPCNSLPFRSISAPHCHIATIIDCLSPGQHSSTYAMHPTVSNVEGQQNPRRE